jgi:uncharacterized membrane protein YdjX (TVP38/TMEM64 family)
MSDDGCMAVSFVTFLRRYGPLLVGVALVGAVVLAVYAFGVGRFDFADIAREYTEITERIAAAPVASAFVVMGMYTLVVVALVPGAPLLTVPLGLVFGWVAASIFVLLAMMVGVAILFVATTRFLPARLTDAAGARLERHGRGFHANAFGYLLFLRLMPAVPFSLLNIALPALKVPFALFAATTAAGMVPRILVYAYAGEGLRSLLAERAAACVGVVGRCEIDISAQDFLTPEIVTATALLCIVSLVPMVWAWMRR